LALIGGTLGTFSAADPGAGTMVLVDQGLEYTAPACQGTTCLYGGLTPQD
jgi:hypothetical protein